MRGHTLPPGSRGLPLVGETWSFLRDPAFIEKRVARYGPVFTTHLLGAPTVVVSSPEAVQTLLVTMPDHFSSAGGFPRSVQRLLAGSLILQDGPAAARTRQLLMPAFHRQALVGYMERIAVLTQQAIAQWLATQEFRWFEAFKDLTFDIIMQVVLGDVTPTESKHLSRIFTVLSHGLLTLWPTPIPGTRFHKAWAARTELRAYIHSRLDSRQQTPQHDVVSLLLHTTDADGQPLTEDAIVDQVLLLLFAGHETTSAVLTSVCHELARHPDMLARARAEQASSSAALTWERLGNMPYLETVLQETERLYPPAAGSFRQVIVPITLDRWKIPAGWRIYYSIYGIHRLAPQYTNPTCFDPDRFSLARAEHKHHPFGFLPFGGGPRTCIGMPFARLTMNIILAELVRGYEWDLLGHDRAYQRIPMVRPRDGGWVTFRCWRGALPATARQAAT